MCVCGKFCDFFLRDGNIKNKKDKRLENEKKGEQSRVERQEAQIGEMRRYKTSARARPPCKKAQIYHTKRCVVNTLQQHN